MSAKSAMNAWLKTRVAVASDMGFDSWVLDSGLLGLRVAVFGGTHGDETEGVLAAGRLAGAALALKGTVRISVCEAYSVSPTIGQPTVSDGRS